MENPAEGAAFGRAHSLNPICLPPKAPSTISDCSNSLLSGLTNCMEPYKRQYQHTSSTSFIPQMNISWIDHILEFPDSSTGIGSHRRSVSDSISVLDRFRNSTAAENAREAGSFRTVANPALEAWKVDKRNVNAAGDNPSTPSDSNSVNEVSSEDLTSGSFKATRSDPEVQSVSESDSALQMEGDSTAVTSEIEVDTTVDPKRAKRILANRQSAQRSRVRKLHYIAELERSVNILQMQVTTLAPQVSYLDRQRVILNLDNNTLKQKISALIQDKPFKDALNDALNKEVQRQRLILQQYQQQQFSKLDLALLEITPLRPTSDAFNGFLPSGNGLSHGFEVDPAEGMDVPSAEAKFSVEQSYLNFNAGNDKPAKDSNLVE